MNNKKKKHNRIKVGYVTRSSPPTSFPPKSLILFVVLFVCLSGYAAEQVCREEFL
jgi:hypothetical protein